MTQDGFTETPASTGGEEMGGNLAAGSGDSS